MQDALTIAALAATTAAAGILRGYSGFGGGLVMAPIFIRLVGTHDSVALISIIHLLTSFQGVRRSMTLVDFAVVGPLVLAAVLSVPAGVALLTWLDPAMIKTIVALVVTALALAMVVGLRGLGSPSTPKSVAVGILSGLLNGFCGIGGPPAVLYMLAGSSPSVELRASFILFFAVLYPVSVLALLAAGIVGWQVFLIAIALAPAYFLATEFGHFMFRSVHSRLFVPICAIILCLSGLSMLII